MEIQTIELIQAIDKARTQRQMSDRKFSMQILGISPSYWCLLKGGKRSLTLDILRLLMQKLPELAPEVTIFVMRQGNNGNIPKTSTQTEGRNLNLGQLSTPTKESGRKT